MAEVIGFSTALSNDERQDAFISPTNGALLCRSHPHKTNPALGWSSTFQASLPVYATAINTGSGKEADTVPRLPDSLQVVGLPDP